MKQAGVIIGRFQTPHLHEGHKHLIESVRMVSEEVIIFVGTTGGQSTNTDPLDYATIYWMLKKAYPSALVCKLLDVPSDVIWSHKLDEYILDIVEKSEEDYEVTLYGSRDSFMSHYEGRYPTQEVEKLSDHNATELRQGIKRPENFSHLFRQGMIHAANQRYPTSYQAIDCAILDRGNNVLLGKKEGDNDFRFVGGFVDPTDCSLEDTAIREVYEETKVDISEVQYIGSSRIDDHRYRKSEDAIMTAFFIGYICAGTPTASDDIAEVIWVPLDCVIDVIQRGHRDLALMLINHLGGEK